MSFQDDPSSPCPSDRLSVTWADGEKSIGSEMSVHLRVLKQEDLDNASENPSLTTLRPASEEGLPIEEEVRRKLKPEVLTIPNQNDEGGDDFEASVSVILQRNTSMKASKSKKSMKKKSRRRFSSFGGSSMGR